jgi:prephenate dehydrogenase
MSKKVASVYGYGRFGKLWADILAKDFQVKVYSRRGLKKEEVSPAIEIATAESIFECDYMFFCVAISSFEELLKSCKPNYRTSTIYFDTCSVKVMPTEWMKDNLPASSQIIATHPMFGPDSYKNNKESLPIVLCDIRTTGDTFKWWCRYFTEKKLRVELMTPDEHDRMVAYSQGITHYIGRVLADLNLQPNRISTLGYKKLQDIIQQTCNDNWQLFLDLQNFNPYTSSMREELHQSIEKIYSLFEDRKKI